MITITHSHIDGTLLDGTSRGDGSAEVLRPYRWRWSRDLDMWFLPRSRDRRTNRAVIAATADALRAQGANVTVTIDDTPRPTAVVEADRAARAEQRTARLEQRAASRAAAANAAWAADSAATGQLPPGGEPIKAGHHSQRRHEKALERSWATLGKAVEADRAAAAAAQAAAASARAASARHVPSTVANRIRRLESEARQLHRRLDRCGADSDHGRQLRADLDDLDDQIAYWSGIRREQIATGQATDFDQSMIDPGDLVKVSGSWWKVRRANRTTVTLESDGCSIRSPYSSIQTHRRAATHDRPERSD